MCYLKLPRLMLVSKNRLCIKKKKKQKTWNKKTNRAHKQDIVNDFLNVYSYVNDTGNLMGT